MTHTEFVFRRLTEPLKLAGRELPPGAWLFVVIPALILALIFVAWKYRRDARSIAWPFAVMLATLRLSVYGLLAWVFLLPAWQTWETVEKRSRVLLLLDVSASMTDHSDDPPPEDGRPVTRSPRLAKVIDKFTASDFFKDVTAKNPVYAYRFASMLDDEPAKLTADDYREWSAERWSDWSRFDFKNWLTEGLSESGKRTLEQTPPFASKSANLDWGATWLRTPVGVSIPDELAAADRQKLMERRERMAKRLESVAKQSGGTAVAESVLNLLNRESGQMVQGVILVSDGKSNLGPASAIRDLRAKAAREGVPVFSVLVGEDRRPVEIRITDVLAPEQAPPDEKFQLRVEVDGVGLADQSASVQLDLIPPGAEQPAHTLTAEIRFRPGEPPHAAAEFAIDPTLGGLPAALLVPENPKELREGEWKFVARVPRARGELFAGKEHVSEATPIQIIKKPLRVLLVAGGPSHDYQFTRTLLAREKDRNRAELTVFLQNEGRGGRASQDVEAERLLERFPTALRPDDESPADRFSNLANFDLVIAHDPDWSEFRPEQLELLKRWVDQQGGGLVVVGGPVNTFQLARGDEGGQFKPLLDLLPVVPGDSVLSVGPARRANATPWRLQFPGATPDHEFLKLDETGTGLLAGWDEFFGPTNRRGFFTAYPVKSVKPGATVVATLPDPAARLANGQDQPFLVTMPYGKGRVVFLGSGETRRLRQYQESFHERFWMKLGRYAAAGSRTRQNRRGVLVLGRQFVSGNDVRLEAQLFGPSLEPLEQLARPRLTVTKADGAAVRSLELTPKPAAGEWDGWFQARFPTGPAGDYRLELPVPASADVLRGRYTVKAADPERDDPRPDPAVLDQLAGEPAEVDPRLSEAQRIELRSRLRSRYSSSGGDEPRLVFTLESLDAIPICLASERKEQRNRGPVDDVWDDGVVLGRTRDGRPVEVAWVLLAGAGLLSLEWLGRKFLRLA